jgi:hypothetical protein
MNTFLRLAFAATLLSFVTGIASASLSLNTVTLNINGASEDNLIAPATPAAHAVKTSKGVLAAIYCFNDTATPVFIHVYNLGIGSVSIGTTSALVVYGCPGNTAGAGFVEPIFVGVAYSTAISYYVSGAISLTDNTSITASTVIVDVVYQ